MLEHGDDAGHCSNGLSAQNYRGAIAEERAIYRKWRGERARTCSIIATCQSAGLPGGPGVKEGPGGPGGRGGDGGDGGNLILAGTYGETTLRD
jgi:hypothetical protein